jgi:hypothetical protein
MFSACTEHRPRERRMSALRPVTVAFVAASLLTILQLLNAAAWRLSIASHRRLVHAGPTSEALSFQIERSLVRTQDIVVTTQMRARSHPAPAWSRCCAMDACSGACQKRFAAVASVEPKPARRVADARSSEYASATPVPAPQPRSNQSPPPPCCQTASYNHNIVVGSRDQDTSQTLQAYSERLLRDRFVIEPDPVRLRQILLAPAAAEGEHQLYAGL